MTEELVLARLRAELAKRLPAGEQIYSLAIRNELRTHCDDVKWIKSHFSDLVEKTQITAYEFYKEAERKAVSQTLRTVIGPLLPPKAPPDTFFDVLERNFRALDGFFLSLSQGRRARAGKAFEHIIKSLFDSLKYPYTEQPVINGQPDFLLPSEAHFRKNAMDCIIFTVKRTLRERWRQVVTEGTRGYLFFLATIDDGIAAPVLKEIKNHRIYLVVPEHVREKCYSTKPNVISFEDFFEQHLDPAMTRWRRNRVI